MRLGRFGSKVKVKTAWLSSLILLIDSKLTFITKEINWQMEGDRLLLVEHRYLGSTSQLLEHPSPFTMLPSSH
jgi:hypothetical protein